MLSPFGRRLLLLLRLRSTLLLNRGVTLLVMLAVAMLCVPHLGGQSTPPALSVVQVTNTTAGQAPSVDFPTFVSQDGSLVAYVVHESASDWYSGVRLYIGATDATSSPQPITPPGLNVRAFVNSPPSFGRKIAFLACDRTSCETSNSGIPGDVYVVGKDGMGRTQLTFDAPANGSFSPIWYEDAVASGDGRTVAFTQQVPSPSFPNPIKVELLYLIDADGNNRRQIVLPPNAFSGIVEWFQPVSFSADGTELAFVYGDFIGSREAIVRMAAIRTDGTGTGFRKLADPFAPAGPWALSGDWTTLAVATSQGLFVYPLAESPGSPLTAGATPAAYPTISHDGGRICYSALVAYQTVDVFCVKSDGADLTNLSNVPLGFQANFPTLSRDGSVVAFLSSADVVAGRNSDNSVEVFAARLASSGPASPSVTSVTPTSGPTIGGTTVTIVGGGFAPGAIVALGSTLATNTNVENATTITVVTPPHAVGAVDVVVTNQNGQTAALPGAFTYISSGCITTSIEPVEAGSVSLSPAGPCFVSGTSLTITATAAPGYRFLDWYGALTGSTNPAPFMVETSTTIGARFERIPALEGTVGLWDGEFWPLDGVGVQDISVSAQPAVGDAVKASSRGRAQFTFDELEPGSYDLSVVLRYRESVFDNIQPCLGQNVGDFGASLEKTAVIRVRYQHSGNARISVRVPPPVVFVHGIWSSFKKWFSSEAITSSLMWDDLLRRSGFITLAPSYFSLTHGDWTKSVQTIRAHVDTHLRQLTTRATSQKLPRWTAVAHSQGGLVIRAMLSSPPSIDPVSASLDRIFLLGTPNSGAVNSIASIACAGYLSVDNVMRDFNTRFPTFKDKPVLAFAGTFLRLSAKRAGWIWGVGAVDWDGLVVEESVYNIYTLNGLLEPLPRIENEKFAYIHTQLGDPSSLRILVSYIMPLIGRPTIEVEDS